jgi:hypothetical protein
LFQFLLGDKSEFVETQAQLADTYQYDNPSQQPPYHEGQVTQAAPQSIKKKKKRKEKNHIPRSILMTFRYPGITLQTPARRAILHPSILCTAPLWVAMLLFKHVDIKASDSE